MQIAILAGGLATRLRPLTAAIPKSMVPIRGKPFLQYQVDLLRARGVTDIVLCVGYLAEQIEERFGDGAEFGVRISYSREGGMLLGTAGALRLARDLLDETFFVMYGDSYLLFDYAEIMAAFRSSPYPALMVVYRNAGKYDTSNVAVEDGLVTVYDKTRQGESLAHIDAGLLALRRDVLDRLPDGRPSSLDGDLFPGLVRDRLVLAYETAQRFYEIGSFAGLREFEQLVAAGGVVA